jgi:Protein of unknown function (DUF3102)
MAHQNGAGLNLCRDRGEARKDVLAGGLNAALAKRTADKVRKHQRRTVAEIISIGTDLIQVKDAVGHGHFGEWIAAEFNWTARTARNYIRAAERFGRRSETVSVLAPATIYLLSAKSTPESIVENVISKLENDEPIDLIHVEDQVRRAREDAKRERKQALAASKDARGEQRRQQAEADAPQLPDGAAAIACDLIKKFGAATVKEIVETANVYLVHDAITTLLAAEGGGQ